MRRTHAAFPPLAAGLSAVAARMEAKDAAQAATTLVQAMKDAQHPPPCVPGGGSVGGGGPHGSQGRATIIVQAMNDTKDGSALFWLAWGLSASSAHLEAKDAATIAAQAATILVQAIKDGKDSGDLSALARGFRSVDPPGIERCLAAPIIVQAMKDAKAPIALSFPGG